MKHLFSIATILYATAVLAPAQVTINEAAFGKSLGGWKKHGKKAAEYPLSGSTYRTFRPEVTPTPNGGLFVSIRIDHVRGIFSSNDHATLEITVNANGGIESAQSNIAIQGRSISSDVILGTNQAGQAAVGMDRAVQVGTELVANLSAKMLREKIVESGRVTFPAVVRHNYNLLYQSIRVNNPPDPVNQSTAVDSGQTGTPEKAAQPVKSREDGKNKDSATHANLEISPYGTPGKVVPKPQGGN
jgi:hypothetical protein